jgi:hypothetical protein
MKLRFLLVVQIILLSTGRILPGQCNYKFLNPETQKLCLPFELSQNLMIIPVRINNSPILRMVIDSGINNTIITSLSDQDTISVTGARKIKVGGLGDGLPIEAFYSKGNRIRLESPDDHEVGISGDEMDLYVLTTDEFELSRQLGTTVNGLIGSDLFEKFVIAMDPIAREITFHNRETFKFKKVTRSYAKVPIKVINGKAYIEVNLVQENDTSLKVNLLIDSGASLSIWIATVADPSIIIPQKTVRSLLGQGLNGSITGVNGRAKKIEIGPYVFRKPMISYPDSSSVIGLTLNSERHGSLGNDILRRFNVLFDFSGSVLYLKPNKWFKTPFSYNRSGMDVEKLDPLIPVYTIFSIIPGSPADQAGLQQGDIIESINYLPAFTLTLDDINNVLFGEGGKKVLLQVNRNGEKIKVKFQLEGKI